MSFNTKEEIEIYEKQSSISFKILQSIYKDLITIGEENRLYIKNSTQLIINDKQLVLFQKDSMNINKNNKNYLEYLNLFEYDIQFKYILDSFLTNYDIINGISINRIDNKMFIKNNYTKCKDIIIKEFQLNKDKNNKDERKHILNYLFFTIKKFKNR